ncbi:MAG: diguanylate cyclase [Synechococcaceae cyanobacterium]|nr:diguanylate cyclase [Synechococcaceae cyanobacterium]
MALWKLPAIHSGLLQRTLQLFLPIGGAISLVLLPMVALDEHGRRETLQARGFSLVQAGGLRVQMSLRELRSNTGVLSSVPAMADLLATAASPPPQLRERLQAVFRAQLREYERFRALAVLGSRGEPLAQLSREPGLILARARRTALQRGLALQRGQIWISTVQWQASPGGRSLPELLAVRPLFSATGERRGVLLAVVNLGPLARDFNLITNSEPTQQRGYLLSAEGQAINGLPGEAAGLAFAARYPQVWQRMLQRERGVLSTDHGLFVFLSDPLRQPHSGVNGPDAGSENLFVFDSGRSQGPLGVVIQMPHSAQVGGSLFAQPLGQSLIGLLYMLIGGVSVGLAYYQQNLTGMREEERQLQQRLQTVLRSAGVGMCICDPSGRFLSVNAALCAFFARPEADLLACTWQQLTHPEDLAADQRQAERLLRGELDNYRMRKRFLRPDGSSIWGDLVMACSRNPDGTILDLIGQISDVSELVAKAAYLEAASSAGVVGVWDWDIPRDVVTWDAVMVQLYGLRAETFQSTREAWERAIHPDDKPFVLGELQAALRGWREYQPRFRVVWPDGSIHHLQARSRTTFGPDGAPQRMIGVNYDITEQVERELEVEQQRQLLATTIAALVDPLLVLTLESRSHQAHALSTAELCIAEVNPAAATFFARSQPQLLGQPLAKVLPGSLNPALEAALQAVAQGGPSYLADAQPVLLREGDEPRDLDIRAVAVPPGLVLNFRDVTEQRRAAERLAASEERFRLLAENASDVVFRAALDGVTEWITGSVTPLVGWTPDDLIGKPFAPFVHADDLELLREVDAALCRGERRQFRLRVQCRDGGYRWVGVNARGLVADHGDVVGIVGSWRDAQAEVEAETELDRRARIDPLTGLFNRQEILERLERLAHHRRQGDAALAVLFCDIDHFKEINDRHGHGGGDAVLRALAERLRASTRSGDLVGRFGGDELLVVLQAMPSLEVAVAIANKVHSAVRAPLPLPTGEVVPTLSIGVTLINPEEPTEAVVNRADQAMYEAKQAGRDRVVAFC